MTKKKSAKSVLYLLFDLRLQIQRIVKILHFFVIFAFIFVECTKANNETIEPPKSLEQISYLINSRTQIFEVEYVGNQIVFRHGHGSTMIDANLIPYICPNENDYWTLNGKDLSIQITKDNNGNTLFPSLKISQNGFLMIDGYNTNFLVGNFKSETLSINTFKYWAVSRANSYLCFYSSDNENFIIPIVESPNYVIPDYFFNLVVEKEKEAETYVKGIAEDKSLSYVFFTDAHWGRNQKHSPAIIKHIVDYSNINQVLFGGDANTSRTETVQGTLDIGYQFHDAFSFLGPRLFCLFGNHDDNSTGQPTITERHLSEEQVYAYLQSQMTNVHYWDSYNFYYDDPSSKTRFICLDTGRFYLKAFRGYTPKTAQFVIECLSDVPPGWHIVAASHIWANLKDFKTGEIQESVYVRPIIEILENYNLRLSSSFSYGDKTMMYDFSNAGATIEYCIGGHTHSDAMVLSKRGIPLINVTCDGQQEVAGGAPYTTCTINEQCVVIVVNDYERRKIKIYHIGRGNDVSFDMWVSSVN